MYPSAIKVISVCWMIFCGIWLIAALSTKRSVYRESRAQRLRYSILLVAGCFLLFRGHRLGYPLNARVIPEMDAIAVTAVISCVAGLVFCLWARAALGRNWSGAITLKEEHELIVRGPYRIVRHPIYTGLLAMLIATVIVQGHLAGIIGAALVFISFWIKLSHEEKVMLKQFPDQYAVYQQRVKRIIPFVL
jgi:protein-S-isoprenylcysteine O-methyltransferase Ste14